MSRRYTVEQVIALAESVLADIDHERAKIASGQSDLADFAGQLALFRDETVTMIERLRNGIIPEKADRWYSASYYVVGEWPLNHPLGKRLVVLADAYQDGLRLYDGPAQ